MRFFKHIFSMAVALLVSLIAINSSAFARVDVYIDQDTQTARITHNDRLVRRVRVVTGCPGSSLQQVRGGGVKRVITQTGNGNFTVFRREVMHESEQFADPETGVKPKMPFSLFFNRGAAIHGTYNSMASGSCSHGCVRFYLTDAKWLFSFVARETDVRVHVFGEFPKRRHRQEQVARGPSNFLEALFGGN